MGKYSFYNKVPKSKTIINFGQIGMPNYANLSILRINFASQ